MKIDDFLKKYELSGSALSKQLGFNGAEAVNSKRRADRDIPEEWVPRLIELGYEVDGVGNGAATVPPPTEPSFRRDEERPPTPPPDAPRAPEALPVVNYATVAGYIEGFYKLAAQMAIKDADPILAGVIYEAAPQAGAAWAKWIESEPRVAALIQRMMIGTPLGEVIGVHVGIVFSYTLARTAARDIAAEHAARVAAHEAPFDGTPEPPASGDVGAAEDQTTT